MSIEKVREYFKGYGIEDRILEFSVSSATVALAAEALGCEPERIAKTLSFQKDEKLLGIMKLELSGGCRSIFDDKRIHLTADMAVSKGEVTNAVFCSLVTINFFAVTQITDSILAVGIPIFSEQHTHGNTERVSDPGESFQ